MRKIPTARELRLKANQIVHIINAGDQHVYERFDGDVYHFPPKSWVPIRAEVAWIWLGNPDLRDDHAAWQSETARLANRVGEMQWQYRKDGHFYCREFGRGVAHYGMPEQSVNPIVVAKSLDTLDDIQSDLIQTPDTSLLESTEDDLTANVRVVPKGKR